MSPFEYFFIALAVAVTGFRIAMLFPRAGNASDAVNA